MSTKDPIKAAVEEGTKHFENSKQSEADKESLKSLVIRKLLQDCNYDVCDSDLQGNKSKFKVIFWIHLMCNDIDPFTATVLTKTFLTARFFLLVTSKNHFQSLMAYISVSF